MAHLTTGFYKYQNELAHFCVNVEGEITLEKINEYIENVIGLENFITNEDIEQITIGTNVTSIGDYAFNNCCSLKGNLIIPKTVKKIGQYAFTNCYGIDGDLMFHIDVAEIGDFAFYGCSGIKGILEISETRTKFYKHTFTHCNFEKKIDAYDKSISDKFFIIAIINIIIAIIIIMI